MKYLRGIIELKEYGNIIITIKEIMDKNNIGVYQLSKLTGLKHQTIKSYYDNKPITRIDLDVLAKICFVLDCDVNNIIKYIPPKKNIK